MLFGQQLSTLRKKERQWCNLSEMSCYDCREKGHLHQHCPKRKGKAKTDILKTKAAKPDALKLPKGPSNAVFTTMVNLLVLVMESFTKPFYINSGASAHIMPTKCGLCDYVEFNCPVEIAAANDRKIHAIGSGTAQVTTLHDGVICKADLKDIYYVPGIHVQLLSMGKLEVQAWSVHHKDGEMELWDTHRDLFAIVGRVNNVYPIKLTIMLLDSGFAAWMKEEGNEDPTHQDIVKHLDNVTLVTTAKGGKGSGVSVTD